MKKPAVIMWSAALLTLSAMGILGTQLFSGGSNPPAFLMFAMLMLIGGSAETIALLAFENKVLKAAPLVIAVAIALWGTYLCLFSASWVNAGVLDLICDYYAPAVGGIVASVLMKCCRLES